MKTLEEGKKRIQQISDDIRKNVLDPAKNEAQRIIDDGERQKQELIAEGRKEKERLINEAKAEIEKDRNIFDSAMLQASKQAIESFKQQLETKLFNDELHEMLQGQFNEPVTVTNIIDVLVKAIDKEGLAADLKVDISKNVNADEVNKLLAKRILSRLQKQSVEVGSFAGGAKVSVQGKNMNVSLTLEDVKKLLAEHLRKDFRKKIFAS